MRYNYSYVGLDLQEYALPAAQEYTESLLYILLPFSLPFLFGSQQLVVGTVVNCALVLAALNIRGLKLLPIVIMPSIGALAAGMIFSQSYSLALMLPFIWVANTVLVLAIKGLALARGTNGLVALGAGAIAKSALLLTVATALAFGGLVPQAFLTAFGVVQLETALMGGALAMVLQTVKKRFA